MSDLLIDTDVLIDVLRGVKAARSLLADRRQQGDRLCISVLTLAEIYCGKRMEEPGEERRVRRFLQTFRMIFVDGRIAIRGGAFVRRFGCAVPDALIAASAQVRGMILVTRNIAHFQAIEDLELLPFKYR